MITQRFIFYNETKREKKEKINQDLGVYRFIYLKYFFIVFHPIKSQGRK
jgi:hypothetical protein